MISKIVLFFLPLFCMVVAWRLMKNSSTSFFHLPLWSIVLLGLILRIIPAMLLGGRSNYDLDSYALVSQRLLAGEDVYTSIDTSNRHPYLPLQMYWVGLAQWIAQNSGIPFPFVVKWAFIAADVLIIVVIYQWLNKENQYSPTLGASLYAINPIAIYISAYHGQFDSVPILFGLLALMVSSSSPVLSGMWLGLGIWVKSWPVLIAPSILIKLSRWKQRLIFGIMLMIIPIIGIGIYTLLFNADCLQLLIRALGYNHGIGVWGYTYLLRLLSLIFPATKGVISAYFAISRFITLAILTFVFLKVYKKQDTLGVTLTILISFLAFTHAFSIQYLLWVIPFAIIEKDILWLRRYTLAALSYCFLVYNTLILNTNITNLMPLPKADLMIIIPASIPIWLVLLGWSFSRILHSQDRDISVRFSQILDKAWIFVKEKIVYFILIILTIYLVFLYHNWSYDDPYITYRYAYNLAHGRGFVYNPSDKVLSTTSPFFAILLSIPSLLFDDVSKIASFIGCICLVISGYLIWVLGKKLQLHIVGWVGLFLFPLFPLPIMTISSETPLYLAVVLATIVMYINQKWLLTSIFCAILMFIRPDGILLAIILALHWVLTRIQSEGLPDMIKEFKRVGLIPFFVFVVINIIFWGGIWLYFGSPIPVTLFTKQQQGLMSISQKFFPGFIALIKGYAKTPYYLIEAMLAILGTVFLFIKDSKGNFLVAWAILYFAAYSILGVSRYFWYYAPLVPGFIFLVGLGIQSIWDWGGALSDQSKLIVKIIIILLVIGLTFNQGLNLLKLSRNRDNRIEIYKAVGNWLNENTNKNAKIGALEVGVIGYYADRYMVDFAGLLQPNVAGYMKTESTYENTARYAIKTYQPDFIVLHKNIFPELEQQLIDQCSRVKLFKAKSYQATQDIIILKCDFNAGGLYDEDSSIIATDKNTISTDHNSIYFSATKTYGRRCKPAITTY